MKKHIKTLLTAIFAVTAAVCLCLGLAACDKGDDSITLKAPVISYDGKTNTISWEPVEHADGYEIFEDGTSVKTQSETTYKVTQTEEGDYIYTVKALSSDKGYKTSSFSNEAPVTVEAPVLPLKAPEIKLDGKVISWTAVTGADNYDVYENGEKLGSTGGLTSFTINKTVKGTYKYTVVATSRDKRYSESDPSNEVVYEAPLAVTVNVFFPEGYEGSSVTAQMYAGKKLVDSTQVAYIEGEYCTAVLTSEEDGSFTVKLKDVEEGYLSTWAHVSETTVSGEIYIIDSSSALELGVNPITVSEAEAGESLSYAFVAAESKTHSIQTGDSGLTVSINGSAIIASNMGLDVGSFDIEEGEAVLVSVTADEGSYELEIVDYEIKQYIKTLPYFDIENSSGSTNPDVEDSEYTKLFRANTNWLTLSSGKRYMSVDEETTYTVLFFTSNLQYRVVTFKVDGIEYVFSGEQTQHNITFSGRDIEIEITVDGTIGSDYISFIVFPEGAIV